MDLGLKDRVALVTGASSGLGLASARALAMEGMRVVICSRDLDRIERAAEEVQEAVRSSGTVTPAVCDVTDSEALQKLVESTAGQFGRLDVVVSNAGGPPGGRFADLTAEDWERAYNLTFQSTLDLFRFCLPVMVEQGGGVLLVLTSLTAKQPIAGLVTSNTFRAGLTGLVKTIAEEYGPKGIRANTILPGYTKTERLDELAKGISGRDGITIEEVFARWEKLSVLGRIGRPEEIGAAVAFLASRQAAFITGQNLAVDGGAIRGLLG